MAKRKAGVNDIIYELDNDDIEISSDDEVKQPKVQRLESSNCTKTNKEEPKAEPKPVEANEASTVNDEDTHNLSPRNVLNGGKSSYSFVDNERQTCINSHQIDEIDCAKKTAADSCKTTILNEDIVIDSPGNSDLGVEGCENRTPLITIRFRDNKLASCYKHKIKKFMLNLIKLHDNENLDLDNETDLELDIWPEDFAEESEQTAESSLFFVDTDPGVDRAVDVPAYRQTSAVISNIPDKEPTPPPLRRGPTCFNCDGNHPLRDCPKPKDFARIANNRKHVPARVGRYHVEDDQKFGHLIPGRISGQLRHALGLKRYELPLHIYRMRMLGYPPGWLEEARISHSGIAMFDSSGNAILEPDDEEGEVCEPGSKDKFDIKKILDFPGFNVPATQRYKEQADVLGLSPMSEQDSKLAMLQYLAPNAMKAYKRKKLTMFPSTASNNVTLDGQTEMELADSGDEITEFPSVPPLPDEAPPAPPPPPACPPPATPPRSMSPLPLPPKGVEDPGNNSGDDLEVIEVLKVGDIPIPMSDFIVIDEDDSEVDKSQSSNRSSPSLGDLELKKQLLLDALDLSDDKLSINDETVLDDKVTLHNDTISDKTEEIEEKETNQVVAEMVIDGDDHRENIECEESVAIDVDRDREKEDVVKVDNKMNNENTSQLESSDCDNSRIDESNQSLQCADTAQCTSSCEITEPLEITSSQDSIIEINDTLESCSSQNTDSQTIFDSAGTRSRAGHVKTTEYGSPVINTSSYVQLPSDDKFSKDISDVINFENLPNSTGKYKQISVLLKKVKSEVDRIQDS